MEEPAELPYLTPELPGTGGFLRSQPEDFRVDEVPLYEPCGEGGHVYFRMWKRGIDTFEAIRRVGRALDVAEHRFAYAGLKDSRAVTTQWVSTDAVEPAALEALQVPKVAILEVARHGNKLKLGHLRGNHFEIVVRKANLAGAAPVLEVISRRGVPNYFGRQRFGTRGNSHLCGEALLRRNYPLFLDRLVGGPPGREKDPYLAQARKLYDEGRIEDAYEAMPIRQRIEKKALHALIRFDDPERAYFAIPKRMRQMFLSAFQSRLFNRVLAARVQEIDTLEEGDLAYLHRNGAVFSVGETDLDTERARCREFETSPSGPVFGTKMTPAAGRPGRIEADVLDASGFTPAEFEVGGGLNSKGRRRSLRIPLGEVEFEPLDDTSYTVRFQCPPGCYATSVMRELLKPKDPG